MSYTLVSFPIIGGAAELAAKLDSGIHVILDRGHVRGERTSI